MSDDNGESCDFWDFITAIKKGNHQYRLYLFTKPKKYVHSSTDKGKENLNTSIEEKNHNEASIVDNTSENSSTTQNVNDIKKNKSLSKESNINLTKNDMTDQILQDTIKNKSSSNKSNITSTKVDMTDQILQNIMNNKSLSNKSNTYSTKIDEPSCSTGKLSNVASKITSHRYEKQFKDQGFTPLQDMHCNVDFINKDEIDFKTAGLIGQGGFGTVMKTTWRHTLVAVKTIRITYETKYACREICVRNSICHPHIILIMAYAVDFSCCYIVMEFFESHNLRQLLFDMTI